MSTPPIPPEVPIVAATLRIAAEWLHVEQRTMLRDVADDVERGWDNGGTCPLCEEMDCDTGCPLERVRAQVNGPPAAGPTAPSGLLALPPQDDACRQDHPAYDADTRLATPTGQCTRCGLLIQDDRGVWRAVAAAPAQDQPGG